MEMYLFKVQKVMGQKLTHIQVYLILSTSEEEALKSLKENRDYQNNLKSFGENNSLVERITAKEAQDILGYSSMFLGQRYFWR